MHISLKEKGLFLAINNGCMYEPVTPPFLFHSDR